MRVKHKDALVVLIVLLIAAGAFLAFILTNDAEGEKSVAVIYLDGKEYRRVSLDTDEAVTVRIEQENGEVNVIEVSDGCVRMKYSTCKNQLCVRQGDITEASVNALDTGGRIVCLPNRIVVEIMKEG